MSKCRYCLHFDRVSLVERVVKNTRSVDNLPLGVLVLAVTNEEILSCKSVGLDINVCIGNVVDEGRFTNVRETSYYQSPSVSVNLGKAGQMLSDFFQVGQTRLQLLKHGASSA